MGWDPTVLRKYNTTGHFRLLNQLRAELQAHPMPQLEGSATDRAASSKGRSQPRALEVRSTSYGRGRRAPSSASVKGPADASGDLTANRQELQEPSGSSFRDRLNAIEMR